MLGTDTPKHFPYSISAPVEGMAQILLGTDTLKHFSYCISAPVEIKLK